MFVITAWRQGVGFVKRVVLLIVAVVPADLVGLLRKHVNLNVSLKHIAETSHVTQTANSLKNTWVISFVFLLGFKIAP
jgi:hypothetical protein